MSSDKATAKGSLLGAWLPKFRPFVGWVGQRTPGRPGMETRGKKAAGPGCGASSISGNPGPFLRSLPGRKQRQHKPGSHRHKPASHVRVRCRAGPHDRVDPIARSAAHTDLSWRSRSICSHPNERCSACSLVFSSDDESDELGLDGRRPAGGGQLFEVSKASCARK